MSTIIRAKGTISFPLVYTPYVKRCMFNGLFRNMFTNVTRESSKLQTDVTPVTMEFSCHRLHLQGTSRQGCVTGATGMNAMNDKPTTIVNLLV